MNSNKTTRIAVLGASGYVGGQLLAILAGHPNVTITVATSVRYAGQSVAQVYPALAPLKDLTLSSLDTATIASQADLVLSALPHGHSATILGELVDMGMRVCDLSADYRFSDARTYASAYDTHPRPDLTAKAVYGLVEFNRKAIAKAQLVGVPGCYPTASLLALLPALKGGLVNQSAGVVVDAKSGISGAGREAKTGNLFCEVDGGTKAYNVGVHRHQPEMAFQADALGGNGPIDLFFTPQVVPMTRGILSSVYFKLADGADPHAVTAAYQSAYADTPFGEVLDAGNYPSTKQVANTNRFALGIAISKGSGQVAVICAIDNLIKGAAGQGIQCMNLMLGLPEETGLPTMGGIV